MRKNVCLDCGGGTVKSELEKYGGICHRCANSIIDTSYQEKWENINLTPNIK